MKPSTSRISLCNRVNKFTKFYT